MASPTSAASSPPNRPCATSARLYAAIFEAASDAIVSVSVDAQGQVQIFNPAAELIFGMPADTVLGQPIDRLLPATQRTQHRSDVAGFAMSATSRRTMCAGRVKGQRADGQELEPRGLDLEGNGR